MDILLTFTGFHDPYAQGLIGDEEQLGPILSLVTAKKFDKVVLFSTPNTKSNTDATFKALESNQRGLEIEEVELSLIDPTDYFSILRELRNSLKEIIEKGSEADYFISVASGTPQMHACWLLLAASGEIPAHILYVRPPKFVSKDRPLVSEIDLTSPDFPIIRQNFLKIEKTEIIPADTDTIISQIGIVGDHPTVKHALEIAAAFAKTEHPILILGETGTGKELFAKFIHLLSDRAEKDLVVMNCSAINVELAESTLFGHKKGSFTGAVSDQIGLFDRADGSTLFLDEIGELPLVAQAKLLRVLQDGLVEPIGGRKVHDVDVRVIAATNKDLGEAIRNKNFREDLYYRINTGLIELPALRERKTDIPKIALHIMDKINNTLKKPKRLSQNVLTRLQYNSWLGNVRELENVLERTARLIPKDTIDSNDLIIFDPVASKDPFASLPLPEEGFSLEDFLSNSRKQLILKALEISEENQSEAARLLGITPQAINKFLRNK